MNDRTDPDTKSEHDVWPPPPTFRPDIAKPVRQVLPLWVSLLVSGIGRLCYTGSHAWSLWHTHQAMNWWGVPLPGILLFLSPLLAWAVKNSVLRFKMQT